MCLHFCSYILIRQSDSNLSTTERWFASERLKIAVSSANVDVVSCSFVGISAVYRRKRVGPSGFLAGLFDNVLVGCCCVAPYCEGSVVKIRLKKLVSVIRQVCLDFVHETI